MTQEMVILTISDISIKFGGLQALQDITMAVQQNTVHGIIGPNGAGKTTLFNIISGIIKPDTGYVAVMGQTLPHNKPHLLVPLGIARTFQNIRLFKGMTVLDNVMIAQHTHTPTPVLSIITMGKKARHYEAVAREKAMNALEFVGMQEKAGEIVSSLAYGQQRLVEFARAIAAEPKIILLDEPAAGMNPTEKANLLNLIAKLRANGYTLILIEHDMKLVMNICDSIAVLNHGKIITQGSPEAVRNNPEVITAYLGKGGMARAGNQAN